MKKWLAIIIIIIVTQEAIFASEYLYILNDECINELYTKAQTLIQNESISILRDPRGLILRYNFEDPIEEYFNKSLNVYKEIESFLAKIENSAIIEVHIEDFPTMKLKNLKYWEISTMIANEFETIITIPSGNVNKNKIHSVGYGEFLPANNTSNNGGKKFNRIDIIILCNISGE